MTCSIVDLAAYIPWMPYLKLHIVWNYHTSIVIAMSRPVRTNTLSRLTQLGNMEVGGGLFDDFFLKDKQSLPALLLTHACAVFNPIHCTPAFHSNINFV